MRRPVALAAAGTAAALVLGVATAATAQPRWQTIPVRDWHDTDVFWASGRAWFVKRANDGVELSAKSGRVSGSRLGAWVDAKRPGTAYWQFRAQLGNDLLYYEAILPSVDRVNPEKSLRAIELLPNGKLGRPRPVAGAPAPAVSSGSDVIRLPDRPVMLLDVSQGPSAATQTGACCDSEGKTVSYAGVVPRNAYAELGLDRRGRVWLAWTPSAKKQKAGIVELDPKTLLPRRSPSPMPVQFAFAGINSFEALVCRDACRLIVSSGVGPYSWALGERAATRLRLPNNGVAEAVDYDERGRLLAVYSYAVRGDTQVALARGDARGGNLRQLSSIDQPLSLPNVHRGEHPDLGTRVGTGVFGPSAYFLFAGYTTYYTVTMRAAILH